MTLESVLSPFRSQPLCMGGGLVALDVIVVDGEANPPRLGAGGSCGNVLAILSFLGWRCFPVTRLKADLAARKVIEDLEMWGVSTEFVLRQASGTTPIIVERIKRDREGRSIHRFEWLCPSCGSRLPSYRPAPGRMAEEIVRQLPPCEVFYFDRASRFNYEIGRALRAMGALVFFEPQRFEESRLFRDCLELADIVKYSSDRVSEGSPLVEGKLEIQTMGALGLRFRGVGSNGKWVCLPSEPVLFLKDSAGSGDWCSAGIIHYLKSRGINISNEWEVSELVDACRFGQVLAAFNCSFEGARGGMYAVPHENFAAEVRAAWNGSRPENSHYMVPQGSWEQLRTVCPGCTGP